MTERKYLSRFSELIDFVHLYQMKMNYGGDYKQEMDNVLHDIDLMINDGIKVDAKIIRAIVAMTQANVEIWINEDKEREGITDENPDWEAKYKALLRTHKLNSTRSECKAIIEGHIGGRKDEKLNYHKGEWKISW